MITDIKPSLTHDGRYEIIELDINDSNAALESLGTKRKFWFIYNEKRYLFKEGRNNTGENWAEVVVADLCEFLNIPHAPYYLGKVKDRHGVITPSIVPQTGMLIPGNEILAKIDSRYDGSLKYKARLHKVSTVLAALKSFGFEGEHLNTKISNGAEMFVGYLMLDALVGNTDRHHENWAIISHGDKEYLAPSYDHASSLGRELRDEKKHIRLTTKDKNQSIEVYAAKAPSALYETESSKKTLTTFEAFQEAQRKLPHATEYWLNYLNDLDTEMINAIVARIPLSVMSEASFLFAKRMLAFNRDRLLKCIDGDK